MIEWWRRRFATTLQQRLSLLTSLAVAMGVLVTGVAAYLVTRWTLYDQLDRELIGVASSVRGPITNDFDSMGGLNADALRAANVTLALLKSDNTLTRVPGDPVTVRMGPQELTIARQQAGASTRSGVASDGSQYRIVAIPLTSGDRTTQLDGAYALIIARPLQPTQAVLGQLWVVLLVFGLGMAALAAFTGSTVARQGLQPLRELNGAVARITETNELKPIEMHGSDEVTDLARSFNTMLNSLESSRERQRRLIADAGHELRTPLTSLRTNIELLVADEKTGMLPPGARGEILADVASSLGEFSSLIGDLMQLSRDEQVKAQPEPVDLQEVVANAVTRAKRRGPSLHFACQLEPHFLVGEPDQLERAITNLLDNAVKFSPSEGTIRVVMHDGLVVISDEGPGIAPEDLPHIFDRFYRSDQARNTPGTGLGLSIVSHTIASHGGWIEAANVPTGGAMFTLWLPGDETNDDEEEDTLVMPRS